VSRPWAGLLARSSDSGHQRVPRHAVRDAVRTEAEMTELTLGTAAGARVRAVILSGSRVNANAPRACFQEFAVSAAARTGGR
jgi:hypothetical protein